MNFDIVPLRQFLWRRFRIHPERVWLETLLVEDLHLHVLDRIELLVFMERRYGVAFPDYNLSRFEMVFDLVLYVVCGQNEPFAPN